MTNYINGWIHRRAILCWFDCAATQYGELDTSLPPGEPAAVPQPGLSPVPEFIAPVRQGAAYSRPGRLTALQTSAGFFTGSRPWVKQRWACSPPPVHTHRINLLFYDRSSGILRRRFALWMNLSVKWILWAECGGGSFSQNTIKAINLGPRLCLCPCNSLIAV